MAKTASEVLTAAHGRLGYNGGGTPDAPITTFGEWFGWQTQWCAIFVSWCLAAADVERLGRWAKGEDFCPAWVDSFKTNDRWRTADPQPGDLVFYSWNLDGVANHVGLVESVTAAGSIVTIEGNTDERGGGSGGKVMRHVRRANIAGFGHPDYVTLVRDPKTAPGFPVPVVMRPIVDEYAPPEGGAVLVADNGDTYAFGAARYPGPQSRRSHDPYQFEPVVDELTLPTGGILLLATSGAVYALLGAPYQGAANGKDYFRGRTAARLELTSDGRYAIVATSGERYGPGF